MGVFKKKVQSSYGGSAGTYVGEQRLRLKFLPQFSNHLNETCYTRSLWRVGVHDICIYRFAHILRFHIYLYTSCNGKELCLKLLPQHLSLFNDALCVSLFRVHSRYITNIPTQLSDSSS